MILDIKNKQIARQNIDFTLATMFLSQETYIHSIEQNKMNTLIFI